MAAQEDRESHQAFSAVMYATPTASNMEERLILALNAKDGQQSCSQDETNPYTRAVKYVEKHCIVEIFQVTMETRVVG